MVFFIAIAREAGTPGLYERRRTYFGAGRSHLKRTAQAAPSGKPTGAALALVARDFGSVDHGWLTAVGKFMSRNQIWVNGTWGCVSDQKASNVVIPPV